MGFLQFVLQCESCEAAWPPHASSRRQDESFLLLNPGVDRILDPWEPYGYDRPVGALSDPPGPLNTQSCITCDPRPRRQPPPTTKINTHHQGKRYRSFGSVARARSCFTLRSRMHTRALRSLTPAVVAADRYSSCTRARPRVRWGPFAVAAFTVAAFTSLADAFPVPVLHRSSRCRKAQKY